MPGHIIDSAEVGIFEEVIGPLQGVTGLVRWGFLA